MVKREPKTQLLFKCWYFRYIKLINAFMKMHYAHYFLITRM